jgi:IS4 transposase
MLPEVAEVSDPSVAVNVYVPAVFRIRLLNFATPFTAVAVSVLPVKPAGPEATAIVTMEVFDVIVFPLAS